jgi:hypothetical protein
MTFCAGMIAVEPPCRSFTSVSMLDNDLLVGRLEKEQVSCRFRTVHAHCRHDHAACVADVLPTRLGSSSAAIRPGAISTSCLDESTSDLTQPYCIAVSQVSSLPSYAAAAQRLGLVRLAPVAKHCSTLRRHTK